MRPTCSSRRDRTRGAAASALPARCPASRRRTPAESAPPPAPCSRRTAERRSRPYRTRRAAADRRLLAGLEPRDERGVLRQDRRSPWSRRAWSRPLRRRRSRARTDESGALKPPFPGKIGDREWTGMLEWRALRSRRSSAALARSACPVKSRRRAWAGGPLRALDGACDGREVSISLTAAVHTKGWARQQLLLKACLRNRRIGQGLCVGARDFPRRTELYIDDMVSARRVFILLVLLILAAQFAPARAQSGRQPTRILLLYGHDPKSPGVVAFTRELHGVIRSEWSERVEVYEEVLDLDRLGDRQRWPNFASYVAQKYRGFHIDAVIAESSTALEFAVERFDEIFPGVPIVYGNAFEPVIDFSALPANVTGRRIPLPFAETFALARRLQPDAKRVYIVTGAAEMDSTVTSQAIHDLTPLLGGMQLEVLKNWSYPSLLRSLRELPKQSFVILSAFRRDWRGQSFNSGDMIPSVTNAASVPVYGIARNWVGDGIVGGTTMEFASEGARTGRLLVRVLRQPRGARLPDREVAENPTVVDWRQLQRWGLSEKRLPAGTQVLHRTPSPWERYRAAILVILARHRRPVRAPRHAHGRAPQAHSRPAVPAGTGGIRAYAGRAEDGRGAARARRWIACPRPRGGAHRTVRGSGVGRAPRSRGACGSAAGDHPLDSGGKQRTAVSRRRRARRHSRRDPAARRRQCSWAH